MFRVQLEVGIFCELFIVIVAVSNVASTFQLHGVILLQKLAVIVYRDVL